MKMVEYASLIIMKMVEYAWGEYRGDSPMKMIRALQRTTSASAAAKIKKKSKAPEPRRIINWERKVYV